MFCCLSVYVSPVVFFIYVVIVGSNSKFNEFRGWLERWKNKGILVPHRRIRERKCSLYAFVSQVPLNKFTPTLWMGWEHAHAGRAGFGQGRWAWRGVVIL